MTPDAWAEFRAALPWLGGFVVALLTYIATWRRGEVIDDEQERWRREIMQERDRAMADCRRWQRYAQAMDIAHALLWTEWQEWAETMKAIIRRGGLRADERMPLEPNKSSVRFPTPPNGESK